MHDLRHFFAALLIRDGFSPKVVAKHLGHKDAAMTLNVYAHLWPDDETAHARRSTPLRCAHRASSRSA